MPNMALVRQRREQSCLFTAWAALSVSLAVLGPILYVVVSLRRIEPSAKTPIVPALIVLALVVAGTVASLAR